MALDVCAEGLDEHAGKLRGRSARRNNDQRVGRQAETLGELAEFDRATTEAADLIGALVAAMTPPDRDIFLRKYYLLQSGKEIAAALGMSVESVNTRLSRGRDRLRRELTAKGVYSHA